MDLIVAVRQDTREVAVKTVSIYTTYCIASFNIVGCMGLRQAKTRQDDWMDTDLNWEQEERDEKEQEEKARE